MTPWTAACQASLSITNSQSLLKLMSIESVMPSTISSSVVPFSSCLQSFPASRSFPMIQFFTPGGQSIGVSASASVFPKNIQDSRHLGWTGWISLQFCGSVVSCLFSNQWTAVRQASLSTASSQSLLKLGVRRVGDAIQPSHPLSSPSPPAFSLSQHHGLFQ